MTDGQTVFFISVTLGRPFAIGISGDRRDMMKVCSILSIMFGVLGGVRKYVVHIL